MNEYTVIPTETLEAWKQENFLNHLDSCRQDNVSRQDECRRALEAAERAAERREWKLHKTGARCLIRGVTLLLLSAVGAVAGWVAALGICISIGEYAIEWVRCNG